jgi:hypothetical protein
MCWKNDPSASSCPRLLPPSLLFFYITIGSLESTCWRFPSHGANAELQSSFLCLRCVCTAVLEFGKKKHIGNRWVWVPHSPSHMLPLACVRLVAAKNDNSSNAHRPPPPSP